MDTLKDIIKKGLDNKILVLKMGDQYIKNPPLDFLQKAFYEKLALKFARLRGPTSTSKTLFYMQEFHARGGSVHVDMRWMLDEETVSGVTIACPFSFPSSKVVQEAVDESCKKVVGKKISGDEWKTVRPLIKSQISFEVQKRLNQEELNESFLEKFLPNWRNWNRKHVFVPKAVQDLSWFKQPFTVIPPGFVGSTAMSWAILSPYDKGEIEFGVIKPDYMEIFIYSDFGLYNGKASLLFLPREQVKQSLPDTEDEKLGDELWVGFIFTTKNNLPYMLSDRCIEEDYIPPVGYSALPKIIADKLPEELKYWKDGSKERRDRAVEWAKRNLNAYTRKEYSDIPKREELWEF